MKPKRRYTIIPVKDEPPPPKPVDRAVIDATMKRYDKQQKQVEDFLRKRTNDKK